MCEGLALIVFNSGTRFVQVIHIVCEREWASACMCSVHLKTPWPLLLSSNRVLSLLLLFCLLIGPTIPTSWFQCFACLCYLRIISFLQVWSLGCNIIANVGLLESEQALCVVCAYLWIICCSDLNNLRYVHVPSTNKCVWAILSYSAIIIGSKHFSSAHKLRSLLTLALSSSLARGRVYKVAICR